MSNFSSEIQETIYGQLSKSVGGVSKFTVALFPENMGKISVEISYSEAAGLKINMIGDNLEATRILEQNLSTLRESLQTDKLNELIVNLNNNKDSHVLIKSKRSLMVIISKLKRIKTQELRN